MRNASPTTTAESKEFSHNDQTVFLTGQELARIEADPVLEVADIVEYRAEGDE